MLTWEMIQALTTNPTKRFENYRTGSIVGVVDGYIEGIPKENEECTFAQIPNLEINGTWIEHIPRCREVSFMEAFDALYYDDSTIKCKYKGEEYKFESGEDYNFKDDMIAFGKWYIYE